jgi:hypothetical protein
MGASGVNWNNVPHETILGEINGGAGAGPVNDAAASYRRIAGTLREADQDLRDALSASGASWEGQAAGDMQTASTPLATWADEADQLAVQTGTATGVFGDQFADTRASMPAVVSVPSGSWVDDTGLSAIPGVTTDRERAEAAADAAQQEAARRMEAYDNASYDTVQTQYFSQPPTVTLEVPPPSTAGGSVIGGTTGATAGGPSTAGGYVAPGAWTAPGGTVSPSPTVSGGSGGWGGTGGAGGTVPGIPAAVSPTPTIPATTGGLPGGPYPAGGSTGGGVGVLPPTVGGGGGGGGGTAAGVRPGVPGSARPGSSSSGSSGLPGGAPLPGVPGMPGRALGPGGYGPGGYGPGGYGPGGYGPGGYGSGGFGPGGSGPGGHGAAGSGGPGNLAGFGDEAHGQRGGAGPGGFGPGGVDPDGRAGLAGRPGAAGAAAGYGPMGAGGTRGEEDAEHRRPDYLVETEDVWGDGTRVAPPVIGERPM